MSENEIDWRLRALCRGMDTELFFPVGTTGPAAVQAERAKAVCARCPVIEDCRDEIRDWAGACGIWAGTTEDDRISERRRTRRLARA